MAQPPANPKTDALSAELRARSHARRTTNCRTLQRPLANKPSGPLWRSGDWGRRMGRKALLPNRISIARLPLLATQYPLYGPPGLAFPATRRIEYGSEPPNTREEVEWAPTLSDVRYYRCSRSS